MNLNELKQKLPGRSELIIHYTSQNIKSLEMF